jgi:site-specific recombinase XerD
MQERYNFSYFEAEYKSYLLALNVKPVSIKNYLSDIRFFFTWLKSSFQTDTISLSDLPHLLSQASILAFYDYLESFEGSRATLNRRVSTIRSFLSFCVKQQWIAENTAHLLDDQELLEQKQKIVRTYIDSLKKNGRTDNLEHQKNLIINFIMS